MGKPLLVADGGTMTVGRRQATYVYGQFDVRLPEGREQADVEKRLQNGYIYRPDEPARGRFDVAFVRADATVDLTAQTSDLETQIEAAQLRTEGDIFFERDITDSGTGRYRPGIDIKRGDIVDVLIWGRILPLPITRWEMISDDTTSVGWRWHVGGAMIEDAEALRSHNDQLLQQIAQEKRQMTKSIGAVSQQAVSAGKAAAKADDKAVTAQETAEDALVKWRQQKDQLDKVQSELINKNAEWNRLQDVGLKELESQQAAMKRFVELSKPGMVTADSWTPVQAGPVQVSYPARNRIQLYLRPSNTVVGASVLGVARVTALSGYSSSFTVEINAGETVVPSVGGFEAFQKVSVTVHPIVDFAAILTEERRKRGLQQ
ncbi:hypothetical protein I4J35_05825 [Corynebacterium belfantii]|uniref:hypothetical protein n=1 Tax=Corynebacterium belfantii TaxID=2014537 RepID=UPI0018D448D7|nr:hypothetical protein [Corynebacterium belfantii]MBG9328370.1 hypothetical protein [Corynebacterium belfantii]